MKKSIWLALILALLCFISLSSCDDEQTSNNHTHVFGEWTTIKKASCTANGINERFCSCGEKQTQNISAPGHTEVIDVAVSATCTIDGKTEGKHCSVCNETIVAQTVVGKLGHIEVIDTGIPATCTTDGKTEGKHCSRCNETLVAQTVIGKLNHIEVVDEAVAPTCTASGKTEGKHCDRCKTVLIAQTAVQSSGHQFNNGEIIQEAACNQKGIKEFTCMVSTCLHTYTEEYTLPTYTATELYNQSIKYVGEIVVYDKTGTPRSLGTGFVISSDGKIVTNYHVIEGAYSADITINSTTYPIAKILAYDETIDLAVLKINAVGIDYAHVCKNAVQTGETVYAIGSSKGLTNTFSQGIITQSQRVIEGTIHIQHDAAISSGNSGGPLINIYGEVIGINKMSRIDSQNINMAVFTTELDNLVYDTPMTLVEFYEKNLNAYKTLLNWVLENYNSSGSSWIEYRYQESGERFSIYSLTYFYNSNILCLQYYYVFNNDDARYVSIELSEDSTSYKYYATYTDGDYSYKENITQGYIYPSSFTRYTTIGYYSSEGNYWTISSLLETYQEGIVYSLEWFEVFLDVFELGFTLTDFGFNSFY